MIVQWEIEIENDEKQYQKIENIINTQQNKLIDFQNTFDHYNTPQGPNLNESRYKSNYNYNHSNDEYVMHQETIQRSRHDIEKIIKHKTDRMTEVIMSIRNDNERNIINKINNDISNQIKQHFSPNFQRKYVAPHINLSILKSNTTYNNMSKNDHDHEHKSHRRRFSFSAFASSRHKSYSSTKENVNSKTGVNVPAAIQEKRKVMNNNKEHAKNDNDKILWRFDYCYDYKKRGYKMHGIENNGKTIKCNHRAFGCDCFFTISNNSKFSMTPYSGKYTIKIKMNNIDNGSWANIIGITSKNYSKHKSGMSNSAYDDTWYNDSCYIGWSSHYRENNKLLPNGLLCGVNKDSISSNIFRLYKFKYQSRNKNYVKRLPHLKVGDIVVLSYDSNLFTLSFTKENDNGDLNSYIENLPNNQTFYWFVGHSYKQMSMTIVD